MNISEWLLYHSKYLCPRGKTNCDLTPFEIQILEISCEIGRSVQTFLHSTALFALACAMLTGCYTVYTRVHYANVLLLLSLSSELGLSYRCNLWGEYQSFARVICQCTRKLFGLYWIFHLIKHQLFTSHFENLPDMSGEITRTLTFT